MNITEYTSKSTNNNLSITYQNILTTVGNSFVKLNYFNHTMGNNNNINNNNNNKNRSDSAVDSEYLVMMFRNLMTVAARNQTPYKPYLDSLSSSRNNKSYDIFSILSVGFVLIVNPIVILFGVTGNLLATYILIHCNIAKLPVSFYTIMLNISDTLNLLVPVFIFWLDNCINRALEQGYFRDRSNCLCKTLMCLDQLFATLSAWYMCAISFNRWYSVCRPSSYFFRRATSNILGSTFGTTNNNNNYINREQKKHSSNSTGAQSSSFFVPFCFPVNCCSCLTHNIKVQQHLQAFRSIACMTLLGILFCLYPISMNELQPFVSTNKYNFGLEHNKSESNAPVWYRCYVNKRREYAYDVIGIVLSLFLHILPLTFVALMNIMIIIRLKQRQYRMTVASNFFQTQTLAKKSKPINNLNKKLAYQLSSSPKNNDHCREKHPILSQPTLIINRKDQATSTDLSIQTCHLPSQASIQSNNMKTPRRHHSRDRTITIMLVSVALSYLILTIPYRLFWSYNVYLKRMKPTILQSSLYLSKMHYIDHVLRTIRNIHYGTNFVFFIFLSKTFRRKFRQIFIERFFQATNRLFHRNSTTIHTNHIIYSKTNRQRQSNLKLERKRNSKLISGDRVIVIESFSRNIFDEIPSLNGDVRM
ncbi:unnamed protein product [Rotaria magnacalcarata]|uniref:G-protein coupled receptors family 1 profile domain-containing protein n=2 Tax=Rotaria magnacalcarata TaxID=392030 RepID=A0A816RWS5_9BILA|nr:unnamed protein product [Rotaria magnacalcarata]CAF3856106.1 unnamed protein product [Rotaria magnacalcarata]